MKTLKSGSCIDEAVSALREDGVFIVPNFAKEVEELREYVFGLCKTKYEFGKAYRGGKLSVQHDKIKNLFSNRWIRDIAKNYSKTNNNFGESVFATHDFVPRDFNNFGRNGYLHFDRIWYLKFFVYLTDVTKDDGALSVCPGSVSEGFRLRGKLKGDYNSRKNRIEIDYPHLLKKYKPFPIEGDAGTMIVFDTDCFHKGGNVAPGHSRTVIRLHCR